MKIKNIWEEIKTNPLINGLFIFCIVLGILMIIMVLTIGYSTHSETETLEGDQSGFGYGSGLQIGDQIEVTYEIEGEDVDVFIVKGYSLPFNENDEDVKVARHNTNSGTFTYTAEEEGMHMVFFRGYDFTITYSYKVNKPLFTAFIIGSGSFIILLGVFGLRYMARLTFPKYQGNAMKYNTIIFILLGAAMLIVEFMISSEFMVHMITPILMMVFGLENHVLAKSYDRHYIINTKLNPDEAKDKIQDILKGREMDYEVSMFQKEHLIKWYTIIDLNQTDIRIKIRELRFQKSQSGVAIGRRNAINKETVIELANEFARELECAKYKAVLNDSRNPANTLKNQ